MGEESGLVGYDSEWCRGEYQIGNGVGRGNSASSTGYLVY
jgi:hypothetical protein